MNAGPNREKALAGALANAKVDGKPRYVHKYGGVYWVEKSPPPRETVIGGHVGSDYVVVFPHGTYYSYDPTKGPPDVDPHWRGDS